MKIIGSILLIFLLTPFAQGEQECQLLWDKVYFKNLIGEMERNRKTRKKELFFETYNYFQGDFPQKVSLNVPYKGNCSDVKFKEVVSYRNIGPRKFPGKGEDDHAGHALFPRDTKWETKAFETVVPDVTNDEKEKVMVLKSFKIYKALSTLDFKKYHPWQIRYEIFYKDAQGIDNKAKHTVDLKLTH